MPAELHIGPLPEPGLFERLRTNWSLAALVPEFDFEDLRKREWRSAGITALVLHAVMIAGIIVIGKYALATFTEQPSPETVTMLNSEVTEPPETPKPDNPASEPGRAANDAETTAGGAPGGGGGADTRPATGGNPPAMAPKPPIVLPPPPATASLPVTNTVQGPEIPIPQTAGPTGLPDVPPPDGPPSPGTGGDGGIGDGPGSGIGPGPGGPGPGGNDHGTRPGTRPGADGLGAGSNAQGPLVPTPNVPSRGPRFIHKEKPRLTKAMLDNNTFGTVTLRVTVGYDGSIQKVEPVQTLGDGGTEAAIAALRKCTFSPAIRNQHYVTESIIVRFDFTSTADED